MYKQLTSEQRYTISVLLQNRTKQKDIAMAINVSPSTVSREIRRNSGIRGRYNWKSPRPSAMNLTLIIAYIWSDNKVKS